MHRNIIQRHANKMKETGHAKKITLLSVHNLSEKEKYDHVIFLEPKSHKKSKFRKSVHLK